MPRIPQYDPAVQLTHLGPGVEQDKMSFGLENLAAAKSWEGVGQFGEKLSDIGMKLNQAIYHAKQVNDLAGMKMDTTQRLYDLRDQVMKDPDPATWAETYKTEGQKIFDEVSQRSSDMAVQAHYKTAWASHFPVMAHGVTVEARKQQIANFAGDVEVNYGKSIDLYNQAATDVERAKIQADAFALLQGGVSAGFLQPAKAQQLRDGFDRSVTLGQVNKDIANDAVGTFDKLGDPAKYYPSLSAQDALALRGRAHAEMGRMQGDNALEVQKLYENKQLTPENLMAMRDGKAINLGTWKFYDAALQADAAPVKAANDMDLYIPLWQQAQKGQMSPDRVYEGMKAGRLTKQDGHFLIRTNEAYAEGGAEPKELAFTKDPYFRLATKEIEARLKPLEAMANITGMKPGAKETSPTHEAAFLFLEACKTAQKNGELDGPWMWKKANEIIQPFEMMGVRGLKSGTARPAPSADPQQRALEILRQRGRLPAQ